MSSKGPRRKRAQERQVMAALLSIQSHEDFVELSLLSVASGFEAAELKALLVPLIADGLVEANGDLYAEEKAAEERAKKREADGGPPKSAGAPAPRGTGRVYFLCVRLTIDGRIKAQTAASETVDLTAIETRFTNDEAVLYALSWELSGQLEYPVELDDLCKATKLTRDEVLVAIMRMRVKGWVEYDARERAVYVLEAGRGPIIKIDELARRPLDAEHKIKLDYLRRRLQDMEQKPLNLAPPVAYDNPARPEDHWYAINPDAAPEARERDTRRSAVAPSRAAREAEPEPKPPASPSSPPHAMPTIHLSVPVNITNTNTNAHASSNTNTTTNTATATPADENRRSFWEFTNHQVIGGLIVLGIGALVTYLAALMFNAYAAPNGAPPSSQTSTR